jgi:hypothetical protein
MRAPFTGKEFMTKTRRHTPNEDRPPRLWSELESIWRTGVRTPGQEYVQNDLGGATRRMDLYRMDAKRTPKDLQEGFGCKKKEESRGPISPGVLVRFALVCRRCVLLVKRRKET